jgi:hypothetical protein
MQNATYLVVVVVVVAIVVLIIATKIYISYYLFSD